MSWGKARQFGVCKGMKMAALVKTQCDLLSYLRLLWAKIFTEKKGATEHSPPPLGGAISRPCRPPHPPLSSTPSLSILWGGRLQLPGSAPRITRSISDMVSLFPRLLHGLSLHFPTSPWICHSLARALWLICVFTLCPSSSLTASGERIVEGESLDEQKDMKRKRRGGCNERFSSLSLRFGWFTVACKHTYGIHPTNHTVPAELKVQEKKPNLF